MKCKFRVIFTLPSLVFLIMINWACQPTNSSSGGGTKSANGSDKSNKKNTNDGENTSNDNRDNETTPAQPVNCEILWESKVNDHKVGSLVQKQTKQYIVVAGQKTLSTESISTEKISFNNGLKIVTLHTTDFIFPISNHIENESTEEKNIFLELCKNNSNNTSPPPDASFDVVNMADEALVVKAGTFNCSHVMMTSKANTIDNIDKMTIESWFAKEYPGLLVKSNQTTMMNIEGRASESLTEIELIQFKR